MQELAGVQDVFCGPETIVYARSARDDRMPAEIEAALIALEVACDGVERDDSAML